MGRMAGLCSKHIYDTVENTIKNKVEHEKEDGGTEKMWITRKDT